MSEDINRSIRIYLNTTDANKKYDEITASTKRLKNELEELRLAGKENTEEFRKTELQYKRSLATEEKFQTQIKETTRVLKNLSGATLTELNAQYKNLKRELSNTARGTEKYTSTLAQD